MQNAKALKTLELSLTADQLAAAPVIPTTVSSILDQAIRTDRSPRERMILENIKRTNALREKYPWQEELILLMGFRCSLCKDELCRLDHPETFVKGYEIRRYHGRCR